jgi:hypothetical protein
MTKSPRLALTLLALPLLATALAGCDLFRDKVEPITSRSCPKVALLADAGDLLRYRPTGQDLTDLTLAARITAVPATCISGPKGSIKATLSLRTTATRGPAAKDRAVTLPLFVSVVEGDRVRDQADYRLAGVFPPSVDTIALGSDEIELIFSNTPDRPAAASQILIGFRLTPEELALNRKRTR